jgi:hypothetical protein
VEGDRAGTAWGEVEGGVAEVVVVGRRGHGRSRGGRGSL